MADYITDPDLLAQLNSGQDKKYVTDKLLLASLEGKQEQPSFLSRMGRGMLDPIEGGAQLLERGAKSLFPDSVAKVNQFNNYLADKTGLVGRLPEGGVDQLAQDNEKKYQESRGADAGFDGARLLGNIASPANLAIAVKAPAAAVSAGLGLKTALGAATGAASSVLNPVYGDDKDFWKEKAKQAAIGGGTGGILPALGQGLSRVISPNATRNPNLQLLKEEGVTPTIGQTLGGRWNALEEKMQSLPIVGDMITNARKGANSEFETAAFNRALKPIGQELPKGLNGRDALIHTENVLKDSYENVLGKIGALRPDQQFNTKVADLQTMVNKLVMPKAEKAKFSSALNDVNSSIENGAMTSDAFKALESSLGSDASKLGRSTNIYEGKLAPAVKQLQAELREMLQRQAGGNADELKQVNAGWANFKRVQNAGAKIGAEEGNFNPAQFQNAVRTMDKSKDKAMFARGNALGQDLGDAGKAVLGSKVPDSGTAGRLLMGGGAILSGSINPAIPAGLIAGAGMYTKPVQGLLNSAVTSRPQSAQEVAELVKQLSTSSTPFLANLLNYQR
jgi:hypothetical protein